MPVNQREIEYSCSLSRGVIIYVNGRDGKITE